MIGADDLHRHAQNLAAEILHGHARGLRRPFAAEIRIDAGLVVQDADLDDAVRGLLRRGGLRQNGATQGKEQFT
jgi:hypothetical protein